MGIEICINLPGETETRSRMQNLNFYINIDLQKSSQNEELEMTKYQGVAKYCTSLVSFCTCRMIKPRFFNTACASLA